jgi:DnaK suppressor protein
MDTLLPDQLEYLRSLLTRQLDGSTHGQRMPAVEEVETSPADSASKRTMNELAQEADAQRQNHLRALRSALARLENGEYGDCEQCGQPIGFQRLSVSPEARFCIACQTRREQLRR